MKNEVEEAEEEKRSISVVITFFSEFKFFLNYIGFVLFFEH